MAISLLLLTGAGIAYVMIADRAETKNMKSANFTYNEERAVAAVLPGVEFADYRRASYVTAWEIKPGIRKVYITVYDWRSVYPPIENKDSSIIGDETSPYVNAPVVRFQGTVNCENGLFYNPNVYVANDLVSTALKRMTLDAPAEKLTKREVDIICSNETLEKTRDIGNL